MRLRETASLVVVVLISVAYAQRGLTSGQNGQSVKNRAIEMTKGRQRAEMPRDRIGQQMQQRPGRVEVLDVDKLNKLLQAIDKGWTLPKLGSKEPVGSNFQFKKTCANIYKVRHGACQQIGFGIMCFNYCYEQGEKLQFKCVDMSEQAFCRKANSFDTYLTKYRNDAYKAKAFIHQMASRCFSSSVCNTQAGLLNSTLIDSRPALPNNKILPAPSQTPSPQVLPQGGPVPPAPQSRSRGTPPPIPPTPPPEEEELEEIIDEEIERVKSVVKAKVTSTPSPPATPKASGRPVNIWDRFTIEPVGNSALTTAKYIPFWQRLLSTTTSPPATTTITTTTQQPTTTTTAYKYTWRPLMVTAPPPPGPERKLTHQLTIEEEVEEENDRRPSLPHLPPTPDVEAVKEPAGRRGETDESKGEREHESGFWSRFQPGRWFQSIHFVTNTG